MIKAFFARHLKSSPALALFCAVLGSAVIGLSPTFVRLSEVGPTATAFHRFFFAMPCLWAWMVFDHTKSKEYRIPRTGHEFMLIMLAGLLLALDIMMWHFSMLKTSIINAMLLNNFAPVFVALAAWLFYGEKMSLALILGLSLAVFGSVVLVGQNFSFGSETVIGDGIALLSAFFYAAYILVIKRLRGVFSTPTILMWSSFTSLYVLALGAFLMGEKIMPETTEGWILVMCLGFFVHIGGQGLLSYSMGHLTATLSSIITLIGPLVAAILGWIIFNEHLGIMQITGGIIVILGIMLSRQTKLVIRRKKKIQELS